jgi:RNA polymerase sigma factor (TIGR02999 family)
LLAWRGGDEHALERLIPLLHRELRRIARALMRGERSCHTLEPTALVNEAYLRLVDVRRIEWRDRAHFLSVAARLMRRILVDHARAHRYQKRGGGRSRSRSTATSPYRRSPAAISSRSTTPWQRLHG